MHATELFTENVKIFVLVLISLNCIERIFYCLWDKAISLRLPILYLYSVETILDPSERNWFIHFLILNNESESRSFFASIGLDMV